MTITTFSLFTTAWIIVIERFNSIFKILNYPFDKTFSLMMNVYGVSISVTLQAYGYQVPPTVYTVCLPYLSTNDLMNFSATSIFIPEKCVFRVMFYV